jgi:hypothetical protein
MAKRSMVRIRCQQNRDAVGGNEKLRAVADLKEVAEAEEASVPRNGIRERRIRELFDRL